MRQHKRRLCTSLLCAVLIISNVLSAGVPVYAKTPTADSDVMNAVYSDGTAAPMTENEAGKTSAASNGADQQDGAGTDSNATSDIDNDSNSDSGSETGGSNSDANPNDNTGTENSSDPNTDPDNTGTGNDSDDTTAPGDDTNTNPGNGDGINHDDSSNDGSDSTTDNGDDSNADNAAVIEDGSGADNTDGKDETTVSGNDTDIESDAADDSFNSTLSSDDSDYLTEDPENYGLTDIAMTPGSYSAEFSAVSERTISSGDLSIMYTTSETDAANFFKGVSKISSSEVINNSSYKTSNFMDLASEYQSENYNYKVSGTFKGDDKLTPDTTYYYRLCYYKYSNTDRQYYYYFLTVPDQFTTNAPVTESSVSIRDFSVEAIGYQRAKITWTIDNPNNEALFDMKLLYASADGTQNSYTIPSEYRDEKYNTIPNKYYATVDLDWARIVKAVLTTYIGAGEEKIIASEEITLTPQDINNAAILMTPKTGTSSFQALVTLSPYYQIDGSIQFNLNYREKSDTVTSWQTTSGYAYGSTDSASVSVTLQASGLSADTEYEYYIVPSGRLAERTFENLGTEAAPLSFTTNSIVTYEDTDFPDEVFRSFIKRQIGITDADRITSDKLEKLTRLDCARSSAAGDIRSLQGIEHIDNLTRITFSGHAITDVGGLTTLPALADMNFEYNDLTELPDLSGMSQLKYAYFDYNRIKADTITEAKLPASLYTDLSSWVENTKRSQRAEQEVTLAPEYYAAGEARPFLLKVTGLKNDSRNYTLSLTIGGVTVSDTETSAYNGICCIKNILKDSAGTDTGIAVTPGTPCDAVITLTDSYGNQWLNQTAAITFSAAKEPVAETRYIRPNAAYASIRIENLPVSYTEDSVASVTLCDQSKTPVGSADPSNMNIYASSYNPYEDVFGSFYLDGVTTGSSVQLYTTVYFAKYLTAGSYSAVVTTTDGTSSAFEKAVCVDDVAVLDNLTNTSNQSDQYYDDYGDYLYVMLYGGNINPAKVRPVFYENEEAITECINGISAGYNKQQAVYKLKKLKKDTYWNLSGSKTFTYRLEADAGYKIIDNIRNKSLTLDTPSETKGFITFEHYNYKKGVYEVKTDSTVTDGTKVSVSVYDNSSSKVLMGKAQGEITNSLLSLEFKNDQGESYAPPKDKEAYFIYTYTGADGTEKSFTHTNSSVKWYNYYPTSSGGSSSSSAYTNTVLYHKTLLKKLAISIFIPDEKVQAGQPVDAQIYTANDSTAVGEKVSLTGNSSKGFTNYTGIWTNADGLGEGIYQIRYSQNGRQLYSHALYVYDDAKFYMNDQWLYTWSDRSEEGICFAFSSEQLAGNYIHDHNSKVDAKTALDHWNNSGYKLELFDRLGNPISGWKVDHASWSGSNFYLYLKDVPEGYVGFYVKATRTGRLGIRLRDGLVYYSAVSNASEKYGEWETFNSSSIWFNDDSATNAYYGFGSYAYPVDVTITRPYDTEVIQAFTASAATSGNYYYFTANDLKNTDPKEAYRITAAAADGSSRSEIGYLAVRGTSTIVKVTGVTLNKTSLNMQLNQTEKLTATVTPDDATNKNVTWTTSNDSVAVVDAQGNVKAVGTGEATITVTTADGGKTASCTVQVFNYTLSQTELSFDLSNWTTDQAVTLKVSDGTNDISSKVTWSSNDESVVTVTKGGVVTPEGAGSAKILAAVNSGPILTCDVTVSRDTLTGITLNESACTLYLDSKGTAVSSKPNTKLLKLYLTPSDTTVDSITWTSDQPTIASITAKATDPTLATVTAKAKGSAKITAAVTTKSGTKTAFCTVTVQTVTTADDVSIPSGLTALTNEQLTLKDVTLPAGWEWMYPEVTLKQFAGMQSKAFAAQYKKTPDAIPYEHPLSVALTTVTGIAIGADGNSLQTDKSKTLSLIWNRNGNPLALSAHENKVEWSIDKPAVAKIDAVKGPSTTLTAVGTGKATVKAQVTFKDGKTYKAQYKVTVVDGEMADIKVTAVDGFTPDADLQGAYRGRVDSSADNNNGTIHVTVTGASKLTVKNNNAKVIAAGKATAQGSEYSIPLTLNAAGMARITLTANDAAKTQKELYLYVTDAKPNIGEDTVTVNLWQTTGSTFTLYPNDGYQVTSAALTGTDAAKFTLTQADKTPTKYVIKAKEGTAKGSYKLALQGKVKSGTAEYDYDNVAFTVKVIDQAPKYKIKQSAKVNLFYKDWNNSLLEITSDETLKGAALTDCDFTLENANGSLYLKAKRSDITTNCDKKGLLTLSFAGYKDVTANFTVNTEKKAPRCTLKNKSMTVYPAAGLNSAVLNPLVYRPDGSLYGDVLYQLDNKTSSAGFILTHENQDQTGDFLIQYTGGTANLKNTTYKASFTLTHNSWTDSVTVPFTIKVNGNKPAVKLGKSTLQLNTNAATMAYDTAATEVKWKDGAAFNPLNVRVSATDAKSRGIINTGVVFAYDQAQKQVVAKLNNTAVTKGSYKFKVNVIVNDTLTVSTPLTIKIVDVVMDKAIKVSAKGSIDILNREGTFVTVTPALKSLNGNIADVRLSGRAAHLFDAECENNKVIIRAKSSAVLITKYNYRLQLNLTLENAEGNIMHYMTPEITLKVKQGRPKVTVAPKKATLFSGSYENITRNISATLKGAENPNIIDVELMNNTEAFTCDYADGVIALRSTPNTIKGKTYSLQFRVTFEGQADNEKPMIVKYTVKVK